MAFAPMMIRWRVRRLPAEAAAEVSAEGWDAAWLSERRAEPRRNSSGAVDSVGEQADENPLSCEGLPGQGRGERGVYCSMRAPLRSGG
jgi:hypothetical protein